MRTFEQWALTVAAAAVLLLIPSTITIAQEWQPPGWLNPPCFNRRGRQSKRQSPQYPSPGLTKVIQGVVFVGCTIALTAISLGALAEDWRKMSAADAPSKLLSLTFPDGSVVGAGHSGTWGAWTVFIDPRDPAIVDKAGLESAVGHPEQHYHAMTIQHLKCRNDLAGEGICGMTLTENPFGRAGDICVLGGDKLKMFRIECPVDVKLRR